MARCFPFNRSDYVNPEEPLIDSIKLQAEKAIAKERKKEKKEKKHRSEKSKEHKENSKHEHTHKRRKHGDRDQLGGQDDRTKELRKHVIDQLEQSSVTEENWLTCPNLNPYDSSDSTQDSSKRRKSSASVLVHSGSGLTLRIKPPQQKNTNVERPETSVQPQASNSGRTVEKEQLPVESRPPLIQESRDPGRPTSNSRSSVSGKVVVSPQLPKNTAVEGPATSVRPQSSNSARIVGKEQLPLKSRSPLIHESRDSGRHASSNSVAGKDVVAPPLQKNTVVERPATSLQHQSSNSGRVVDKEQLHLKSRSPLIQESLDFARPSSNNRLSVSGKVMAPPLQKNTGVERPTTTSQPQSSDPGRTFDNEQLQLKRKSPLIQGRRNLGPPASNNQPCVSGKVVAPTTQKKTVVERPITSSQPQSSISCRAVDKVELPLKRKSTLIHESRNPELPSSNKRLCVSGRVVGTPPPQKPATSTQPLSQQKSKPLIQESRVVGTPPPEKPATSTQQKSRPLIQESRDSVPPTCNQLHCVSGSAKVPSLVLQQDNASKPLATSVEQPCFSGRAVEGVAAEASRGKPHLEHKRSSRAENMKRQYEDLFVNWTPPALNFELSDSGNQDWLFATNRSSAQKCASPPVLPDCGSTVFPMQPRAQYLPEFNTYALPYVLPF